MGFLKSLCLSVFEDILTCDIIVQEVIKVALPARKYNFEEIVKAVPTLSPEEKETLEIMLQEDLYNEIKARRKEFEEEKEEGGTFSVEEVIEEIEQN